MENCIFCQIVSGKSPSYKVYEDEMFLGFLDIFPRVKGHTICIPKKHYRWVYDVPEFGKYWEAVLKLTKAMQKALSPSFVTYVTHGLEVAHAHVHILPRTEGETAFVPETRQFPKEEMKEIAEKIFNSVS
ncbi:HIT family protein [Candidatus Roizmanbacteria bacterium]|nr:HIT family protein [Candidatus Roizmanbacteria bacterium]